MNTAMRHVEDGELYLRQRPDSKKWEINFYERSQFVSCLSGLYLQSQRLSESHFLNQTFDSPDEAAKVVQRLVAPNVSETPRQMRCSGRLQSRR